MTKHELYTNILNKKSFLCIGLDADISLVPKHLLAFDDPVFEFNKQIIEATKDLCVAYKPNIAFYEAMGPAGWKCLEKTLSFIPPDIMTIADAKRGDIGNTAKLYAKTFFDVYGFDAVTINPYMGSDAAAPFLDYKDKWTIILGLTSNPGAEEFQMCDLNAPTSGKQKLFELVISRSARWGNPENTMYVVGATKADQLKMIRKIIPKHFLLVPGIGAQGGGLEQVVNNAMNKECGLIVNISRSIIFAGASNNFAQQAREEALKIRSEMEVFLNKMNR